jgi:hypothetical protein
VKRNAVYGAGLLLVMLSLTVTLDAVAPAAPEIDGGSLATGLGLLSGSLLILRSRWRAK